MEGVHINLAVCAFPLHEVTWRRGNQRLAVGLYHPQPDTKEFHLVYACCVKSDELPGIVHGGLGSSVFYLSLSSVDLCSLSGRVLGTPCLLGWAWSGCTVGCTSSTGYTDTSQKRAIDSGWVRRPQITRAFHSPVALLLFPVGNL